MARERWFYAHNLQRRGPVPLAQLVESVLAQSDPRATLVWRKGFADWTRAEDIPEVERKVAPFLARKEAQEAARRAPVAPSPAPPVPAHVAAPRPAPQGSSALIYGGIGAGIVVALVVGAWLVWPRPEPTMPPQLVPLGGDTTENAPAVVITAPGTGAATPRPAPTAAPVPVATPRIAVVPATPPPTPAPTAVSDRESDLPAAEVRKLRGVAAWDATRLRLTVYNGTSWRVTEISAKIFRFKGDDFTEDERPVLLLPPARNVDAGVADLLSKVAPDRKKAGLNPLDTGPFEGEAGTQPESFRFEIETARGYPPR